MTWSSSLIPRCEPHSSASPFPLYTHTIQLFLQSVGIFPSLTIALHISVTQSTPSSPAAFSISAAIPDGPTAFPDFIFEIAALTSLVEISSAGPATASRGSRLPLFQSNSSFSSLSKYSLQTFNNFSCSTTMSPLQSVIHPPPSTSLFLFTILLTTLNTFPFRSCFSSMSPNFFLSASCAAYTALPATFFAKQYALQSDSSFDCLHIWNKRLFSLIALATSSFHHHVSPCLGRPLVLPQVSSETSSRQSFSSFHMLSASPLVLATALACTFSSNCLFTPASFSFQTLHLLTKPSFLFSQSHSALSDKQLTCVVSSRPPLGLQSHP